MNVPLTKSEMQSILYLIENISDTTQSALTVLNYITDLAYVEAKFRLLVEGKSLPETLIPEEDKDVKD